MLKLSDISSREKEAYLMRLLSLYPDCEKVEVYRRQEGCNAIYVFFSDQVDSRIPKKNALQMSSWG